jgi:hypothetical protein
MNENMRIWETVEKTDPDYIKQATLDKRTVTSINQMYNYERATEMWGPVGIGWGWEIILERFDSGAPMYDKEKEILGTESVHTMQVKVWYMDGDTKHETPPQFGHTPYMYMTSTGYIKTDRDYGKKTLTDAVGKCLSLLGFGADIFKGLYDDQEYVSEIRDDFAIEKADDQAQERIRQKNQYEDDKSKHIGMMKAAVTLPELEALFVAILRKASRRKDEAGIKELTKVKDQKKAQLEKKETEK